jgi:hypothetical protein
MSSATIKTSVVPPSESSKQEGLSDTMWLTVLVASMFLSMAMLVVMTVSVVSRLGQEYTYMLCAAMLTQEMVCMVLGFASNRAMYAKKKTIDAFDLDIKPLHYMQNKILFKWMKDWVFLTIAAVVLAAFLLVLITGVLIASLGALAGMWISMVLFVSSASFILTGVSVCRLFYGNKHARETD